VVFVVRTNLYSVPPFYSPTFGGRECGVYTQTCVFALVNLFACRFIRFVWFRFMTCFHVTKFDFVSQTTRQPQSSNNGIMAIKLAFCLDTLPSQFSDPTPAKLIWYMGYNGVGFAGCVCVSVSDYSFIIDISHAFIINDKFSIYLSCRSFGQFNFIRPALVY